VNSDLLLREDAKNTDQVDLAGKHQRGLGVKRTKQSRESVGMAGRSVVAPKRGEVALIGSFLGRTHTPNVRAPGHRPNLCGGARAVLRQDGLCMCVQVVRRDECRCVASLCRTQCPDSMEDAAKPDER
jgi:hypothetical protein